MNSHAQFPVIPECEDILRAGGLPPFAALRAFEAVGRLGGVRAAAQALRLDHAVVSRHIRSLESWTGCKLVERKNGVQHLTSDGERYLERLSVAIGEIASATREVMHHDNDRLTIWCSPGIAFLWLTERLLDFQAANPEFNLELRPTDTAPDLSRYEADLDIRYRTPSAAPLPESVQMLELVRPVMIPVASPEFAAAMDPVAHPSDLLDAPLLHEDTCQKWRWWFGQHGIDAPSDLGGPRLWHVHLTVEAARRGRGIALSNPFLLGDDLAAGRLVNVLKRFEAPVGAGAYVLAARSDRWQRPAIARFRLWLVREVARQPAREAA